MADYQSYPPSLLMLPASHDLQLVGTEVGVTLEVNFVWDSDGKSATIDFDDGTAPVTTTTEAANHTYADFGVYNPRVVSGRASDSAQLTLEEAAGEPTGSDSEPPPDSYVAIPVDSPTDN